MNRIFSSSNWRGEVEKTVKKNIRLQEKLRLQQGILDKLGVKFNLDTGEPKEGKLLTKEEAEQFTAFTELKLKPADIKKMAEEHGKLKEKEDERTAEEQFQSAAEALEFENVPALTRWLVREGLVLEFKDQRVEEEQEDGSTKKVLKKVPYVRPKADEKASLEPLEEYIEREVPEFVDTFRTKPGAEDETEENEDGTDLIPRVAKGTKTPAVRPGVRFPAARAGSAETPASKDKKTLEQIEENARSNPMYRF